MRFAWIGAPRALIALSISSMSRRVISPALRESKRGIKSLWTPLCSARQIRFVALTCSNPARGANRDLERVSDDPHPRPRPGWRHAAAAGKID